MPTHYHPRLRNHENLSYGNQEIVPHVPHKISVSNAPPSFQGQEASSSREIRSSFFEENIFYLRSDMKKRNDSDEYILYSFHPHVLCVFVLFL